MRKVISVLAVLVLLASLLLTALRFAPFATEPTAMAAAFSSYAVVGYLLAIVLLLALVRRSTRRGLVLGGVVVSLVAIAVHAYWVAPLYYGNARGEAGDLVVMTVNMEFGQADADTIVRTAADKGVDVLVLEEVNEAAVARLDASGLADLLPERAGEPAETASGTMVFAGAPLTDVEDLDLGNGGFRVRVGGDHPFTLLAVHTSPPHYGAANWARDLERVRDAAEAAVANGPVLAVGDFNATTDHAQFRDVLGAGLSDVRAQANTGWQPTWPTSDFHHLFPLITIDHVLTTSTWSAMSTETLDIAGTDHRGLLVRLDRI